VEVAHFHAAETSTRRNNAGKLLLRDSPLYLLAFTCPTRSELFSRVERSQATIKTYQSRQQLPSATANQQRHQRHGDTQPWQQLVQGNLLSFSCRATPAVN
jgi:hypothetical protein